MKRNKVFVMALLIGGGYLVYNELASTVAFANHLQWRISNAKMPTLQGGTLMFPVTVAVDNHTQVPMKIDQLYVKIELEEKGSPGSWGLVASSSPDLRNRQITPFATTQLNITVLSGALDTITAAAKMLPNIGRNRIKVTTTVTVAGIRGSQEAFFTV